MIYLDNAATTFPSPAALDAFLTEAKLGANPSSMHRAGFDAHLRLEDYRARLARILGAKSEEITFTAGGTESANLALLGVCAANRRTGGKILLSDAEHPCVSETATALSRQGFEIVKIPTRGGQLDLAALEEAMDASVILVALMHTNNETGAIFDVPAAADIVHRKNPRAVLFADCVQSFCKVPFTVSSLKADLLSLSAHKIHGVRGVGALYVRRGVRLCQTLFGGGQEHGLRSGTENTPAIAAFVCAAEELSRDAAHYQERLTALRTRLADGLCALPGVEVLTPPRPACHIVSASFDGYKSEVLLHLLSERGIHVSAGSACSSKSNRKSPILLAHGLDARRADSTLRLSLGRENCAEEIDEVLTELEDILTKGTYSI